ncbi:MAG: fimbrial protein [Gammaproteobacteria bacterium]|nr:fimbrial protein [Gammaproteobacteria bacterium]
MNINDLKNLNWQEIGAWPKKVKLVFVVACVLISFVIFFLLGNVAQYSSLSDAEQQEQGLKQSLTADIPKAVLQTQQTQQLNKLSLSIKEYHRSLPKPEHLSHILENLTKIAANNQLSLILLKPEAVQQEEFYAKIPIQIEVVGNYFQLDNFFKDIAKLDYYIYFNKLAITLANGKADSAKAEGKPLPVDALKAKMTAELYYFSPKPKSKKAETHNAKE